MGVTNTFQQVGKFTSTESVGAEQALYSLPAWCPRKPLCLGQTSQRPGTPAPWVPPGSGPVSPLRATAALPTSCPISVCVSPRLP